MKFRKIVSQSDIDNMEKNKKELRKRDNMGQPIMGFYGAAYDGGTFIRTTDELAVEVGKTIEVYGTSLYDGIWMVHQKFKYDKLWGYRIEKKWIGLPAGFDYFGNVSNDNQAWVQVVK